MESGRLIITGVAPGVYRRTLSGRDRVFGIKLQPGAARLLTETPIRSLSGTGQAAEDLLTDGQQLAGRLRDAGTDDDRIATFTGYLRQRRLSPTRELIMVQRAVELLVGTPGITRVRDATGQLGISERQLQRLFGDFLGLTPGWVLRRGRLHAAAERLITLAIERSEPLSDVAAEFGYADQAHLTKDFRRYLGMPPSSWLADLITEHRTLDVVMPRPITPPT
jgi:AraC-like DNA-binding protein